MIIKSSAVTQRAQMAKIMIRGDKLYLDYRVQGKRVQRSTGLENTPQNRKILEKKVIPELIHKISTGDLTKPKEQKFSHYFTKFLRLKEADKSYHNAIYIYKKVNTFFGNYNVSKITRLMVKEYLFSLNIKDKTKKDYLGCIKGVLELAIDDEIIQDNAAKDIKFKRAVKEPIEPFSNEEVASLIGASSDMLKNYLGIALATGMRSGEILGLMHQDILDDRIQIRRSISKGRITTPKTLGSIRDIPKFVDAIPFIEDQIARSESLYLFDYNGKFLRDISYFKRRWKQLVEDSGIKYRKIYNTRHTFVTAMLNNTNLKVMDIAKIVGHNSPQMIMTTYAGFLKDEHLKIDANLNLFGDSLVTVVKSESLKKA